MFSIMVLLNSVTSWNTIEYNDKSVSGLIFEMFSPPTVIVPFEISQKREASRETVVLPPPEVTDKCSNFALLSGE